MITGVMMVGGASRRMGQVKAKLPAFSIGSQDSISVQGMSQGRALSHMMERALGYSPWVCGEGEYGDETLDRVPDREPGAGPLSGLLGLFDRDPKRTYLVLACDLFAMTTPALSWLLSFEYRLQESQIAAIWPMLPGRDFGEPLAALYAPQARPHLEHAWHMGKRSLKGAIPSLNRLDPNIPKDHHLAFEGANTPEQLKHLRSRFYRTEG